MNEIRNWDELRQRHEDFWTLAQVARPLICVTYDAYQDTELVAAAVSEGELHPDSIDPGPILPVYDQIAAARGLVGDDMIAVAEPLLGIPWLEALAGCRVLVPQGKSLWPERPAGPPPAAIRFSSDNPWFRKLLDVLQAVVNHAAGRYAVSVSHLRGPTDILAALLGSEALFMGFYENPERIQRLAQEAAALWLAVARAEARIVPAYRGGYGVRQFGLWAPRRAVWLQDDTSSMMSLAHYKQFFLEPMRRMAIFPYGVLHLHIPSLHLAETLAEIDNIQAINFYFDSKKISLQDAMPTLRRLQARNMPLILAKDVYEGFTLAEYEEILDGLSPAGLSVHLKADTVEEGRAVMAAVHERAGKIP